MNKGALNANVFLFLLIVISGCGNLFKKEKLFKLLNSEKTGITFNNKIEESYEMNIISYPDFYSGGGVAIGDIDNDGLSDIFFTGNQVPSRLYKNQGNLVFEDITVSSKLDKMGKGWYTGTSMVDLNADGFLDIYICKSGMGTPEERANLLFINNGDGTFSEKSKEYGLDNQGFGVNAVFFDYDNDGDIDVYIANQVSSRLNSSDAVRLRNVFDDYAGDKMYENIGGKFIDVSEKCGIYSSKIGFAHGVAVGDINDDGWEDLFVSNDFFEYDYLYLNNGDKTFTESIKKATKHISYSSMGNDLADFNNDGLLDLVVLDMVAEGNRRLYANTGGFGEQRFNRLVQHGLHYQYMFNVMHLNNGNGTFSEIGMLAGISRTDWSWAPILADFDNDGFKDLYITNGIRKDVRNIDWSINYKNMTQFVSSYLKFEESQWDMLLNSMPFEPVQNYMYQNNGDMTFSKVMGEWGLDQKSYSNGVAYGDLDNDGDLDLVVNNIDAKAFVYENRNKESNFIRFKFEGPQKNPMALGTKVRIYHNNHFQYQQHYTSRGYRSSMEPVMHFGIGKDTLINKVEVTWPNGKISIINQIKSNQVVQLKYSDSIDSILIVSHEPEYYFENMTNQLGIAINHLDMEIGDIMTNPMLPYKLSMLGPPLTVADVNGDSLDDFFLGGSFGYEGQLFIQTAEGSFLPSQIDFWKEEKQFEDVGATFFDIDNDGDKDLYIVSGCNGNTIKKDGLQDRLYLNDGNGIFCRAIDLITEFYSSGSVAVPGDFDQDGDLDLFVGGRLVPGSYPFSTDSYLFKNQNGKLEDFTEEIAPELKKLGMVTDALWSDYDLDGDLDLIVVGEWMPITIFNNNQGRLNKIENKNNGLDYSAGWWWSIIASDFDNDGDEDYVVGNIGLNYKFKASRLDPLEIFADDFDNNGKVDIAMGYHQNGKIFPTSDRDKTILQIPHMKTKITSNNDYAIATLNDIYGKEKLDKAVNKKIYTMASGYIENLGQGKFEFKPFDNYAQFSNINSMIVHDVDMDGNKDLIMAGNLYSMEAETIRNDAGIGIWMKGDGKGNFISIPTMKSGLFLDGDIRSVKLLKLEKGVLLICAKNNDFVQAIKINIP